MYIVFWVPDLIIDYGVSHHVAAGNWTQDLQNSSQFSRPLSDLSSPKLFSMTVYAHFFSFLALKHILKYFVPI